MCSLWFDFTLCEAHDHWRIQHCIFPQKNLLQEVHLTVQALHVHFLPVGFVAMSCFAPATGFGLGCTTIIDLFMTHDGLRIPRILNFPLTCRHGRRIFQNILNTYVLRMVKSVKWTLCPPTESTARGEHQTRLLWTISAVHCNLKERLHSHSTVTPQSLHSHSTVTPLTFHLAPGMQETRLTRQIHRSFHGFFHFFPWFHKVCKDRVPTPQSASRLAQCTGSVRAFR